VPLLKEYADGNPTPDLGPGWHWADAPVLYPAVAAAAGLTPDNAEGIIQWLETH
jgi:hypothetical protein